MLRETLGYVHARTTLHELLVRAILNQAVLPVKMRVGDSTAVAHPRFNRECTRLGACHLKVTQETCIAETRRTRRFLHILCALCASHVSEPSHPKVEHSPLLAEAFYNQSISKRAR